MGSLPIDLPDISSVDIGNMPFGSGFFEKLLDALYDGVYLVDTQRRILFWNRGAERLSGCAQEEVLGRRCGDGFLRCVDEESCGLCNSGCQLVEAMTTGLPIDMRVFLLHKDRRRIAVDVHVTPVRNSQNEIIGSVQVFRDASSAVALEKAYVMLRETAEKDPLTGVANRRQMDRSIEDQLALLKRTGIPFNIIMTDIDHFKQINDTCGHVVGDMALVLFTQLLQRQCRGTDLFGRFGGDEFLLLLRQQRLANAVQTAQRMRSVIANYHAEELAGCNFSASFGVTEATLDDSKESLIERADGALYRAKEKGRDRVETA